MGAPDQQHLVAAAQQCIDGDKNRRIGRCRPRLAGRLQRVPLALQCTVGGVQGKLAQKIETGIGQLVLYLGQGCLGVARCGRKIGGAQGRGIGVGLPSQGAQLPMGKAAQITAGGILEVPDQADFGPLRR